MLVYRRCRDNARVLAFAVPTSSAEKPSVSLSAAISVGVETTTIGRGPVGAATAGRDSAGGSSIEPVSMGAAGVSELGGSGWQAASATARASHWGACATVSLTRQSDARVPV